MEVNKKSLLGESPLSSGYESRLENWSLWVWIPVPDTIWLIGHIYLLRNCKNVAKDLKITWREGKDGPFLQTRNHNCTTVKKVFELGCVILTKNRDVWTCNGYRKRHGLRILPSLSTHLLPGSSTSTWCIALERCRHLSFVDEPDWNRIDRIIAG